MRIGSLHERMEQDVLAVSSGHRQRFIETCRLWGCCIVSGMVIEAATMLEWHKCLVLCSIVSKSTSLSARMD